MLLLGILPLVRSYKMEIIEYKVMGSDQIERDFVRVVNGETETSMTKAFYDEQQAAQATLVTESAPTA